MKYYKRNKEYFLFFLITSVHRAIRFRWVYSFLQQHFLLECYEYFFLLSCIFKCKLMYMKKNSVLIWLVIVYVKCNKNILQLIITFISSFILIKPLCVCHHHIPHQWHDLIHQWYVSIVWVLSALLVIRYSIVESSHYQRSSVTSTHHGFPAPTREHHLPGAMHRSARSLARQHQTQTLRATRWVPLVFVPTEARDASLT